MGPCHLAERFQDREAATKALIELGAVVIPILEPLRDHKDPEVRERVRMILERLRGAADVPSPKPEVPVPVPVPIRIIIQPAG